MTEQDYPTKERIAELYNTWLEKGKEGLEEALKKGQKTKTPLPPEDQQEQTDN
jgi:hypothetical protein